MAFNDLGTVKPGTTLFIPFHTFDSNDPSASVTITGLAVTDIEIYKDGGTTQRASDAGYTLLDTDGIDFDGTTGIHGISIDLADNTTANFYEAGSQYWVVIASITVDAATVNFLAAGFRIGYEGAILDTTIATLASQVSFTLEEGPADDDALNGCQVIVHDLASAIQVAQGFVSDYTGSSKTVTLAIDPGIFTMAAGDNASFFPAYAKGIWDEILTGATHNIANSSGRRLRQIEASFVVAAGTAQAGAAGTITLAAGESATDEIFAGDRIVIVGGTGQGEHGIVTTYNGTTKVATMSQNWVITPDSTSEYEVVPADADVETWQHVVVSNSSTTNMPEMDVFSVSDDATAADNLELDYDGTGLDKSNSTIGTCTTNTDMLTAAAVNAEVDTALADVNLDHLVGTAAPAIAPAGTYIDILADDGTATYDRTTDSLQAVRDRGDAAWTTGAGGSPPDLLQSTTIATLASQTSFTLTAGSADDDAYNGAIAVITDVSTSTQKAVGLVSDYTGSTKTVTLAADPSIFTMAATDNIDIIAAPKQLPDALSDAAGGLPISDAGGLDMDSIKTDTAAILVDTGTTLPAILGSPAADVSADIAAVKVDTAATLVDTAEIGAAGAGLTDLGGMSTAMKAEVNAEADTAISDASLATAANLATVDTNVDAILVDTGTTIPALLPSALVGGKMDSNVGAISASTTAADKLEEGAEANAIGTVNDASPTTTSFVIALTGDTADATDDHYNGRVITFTSGVLLQQSTDITDYDGGTTTVTVTALTSAPGNGDQFVIS